MDESGPSNAANDVEVVGPSREQRLLGKLPEKEGHELTDCIQFLSMFEKPIVRLQLNEGFITEVHKIASFLDPRMRHMGHLSDEERDQLYNVVRTRIAGFHLTQRAPAQLSQPVRHSDSDDEGIMMRRAEAPRNVDEVTLYIEDRFNETASATVTKLMLSVAMLNESD